MPRERTALRRALAILKRALVFALAFFGMCTASIWLDEIERLRPPLFDDPPVVAPDANRPRVTLVVDEFPEAEPDQTSILPERPKSQEGSPR